MDLQRLEVTDGFISFDINLTSNALCYFELQRIEPEMERDSVESGFREHKLYLFHF